MIDLIVLGCELLLWFLNYIAVGLMVTTTLATTNKMFLMLDGNMFTKYLFLWMPLAVLFMYRKVINGAKKITKKKTPTIDNA